MPAQPLLGSPALVDEVVAVIDQQLQISEGLFVRTRGRLKLGLTQRRPGDRQERQSGQTCRVPDPRAAPAPSASAAPAPAAQQPRSAAARGPRVSCRQSSSAHSRSPSSCDRPRKQLAVRDGNRLLVQHPSRPRQRRPPSTTACGRPRRSRSFRSPPPPTGATGERTDLNRGSSHAPIRSRSTVSGKRRRHNAGKSAHGRHAGIESAAADPSL